MAALHGADGVEENQVARHHQEEQDAGRARVHVCRGESRADLYPGRGPGQLGQGLGGSWGGSEVPSHPKHSEVAGFGGDWGSGRDRMILWVPARSEHPTHAFPCPKLKSDPRAIPHTHFPAPNPNL